MSRRAHILERMATKFTVGDGCWEWHGAKTRFGYGQIGEGGAGAPNLLAHRVMYEAMVGPIPQGLHIDHLCRNRSCVRPDHLEPVTKRENDRRGESPAAKNARKTHCKRGHPFDEANTYRIPSSGGRACRTCMTAYKAARDRRKKK